MNPDNKVIDKLKSKKYETNRYNEILKTGNLKEIFSHGSNNCENNNIDNKSFKTSKNILRKNLS